MRPCERVTSVPASLPHQHPLSPGTPSVTIYDFPWTRPVQPAHPIEYAARFVWHGLCKILMDSMF